MYTSILNRIRSTADSDQWIPLFSTKLSKEVLERALQLFGEDEVSTRGRNRLWFEEELTSFAGFQHGLALNSGTSALQLALRILGVEESSLVLMPSLSYMATANAAIYLGAEPVFIDVEENLPLLSVEKLESFLRLECAKHEEGCFHIRSKKKVSAIVPVHLLGEIPNLEAFYHLGKEWKIPILEDQAQGIGAKVDQKIDHRNSIFSFNGNKLLKAGGGGAFLSSDADLITKARHLASTARARGEDYLYDEIG